MKLSPFISGIFGTLGFAVSVLAGLSAGNSVEAILIHGLISAGICYAVGYFVGLMAQQVALEHSKHISQVVAAQDAKDEQARLQEQADQASAAAGNGENVTTNGATPAVPGIR